MINDPQCVYHSVAPTPSAADTGASSGDVMTPVKGKDIASEEAEDVAVTPVVAAPSKVAKAEPMELSKQRSEETTKRTMEVCVNSFAMYIYASFSLVKLNYDSCTVKEESFIWKKYVCISFLPSLYGSEFHLHRH